MDYVLMCDFDGVFVDSMPQLLKLALSCIKKHLGVSFTKEEIREKAAHLSGIPIKESLKILFPQTEKEKLGACIEEIYDGLARMEISTFPGVKDALRFCFEQGFVLVISSAAPRQLPQKWMKKEGVSDLFSEIFGEEQGGKGEHVRLIRQKYRSCQIFFVSDSARDMQFGDIAIGVAVQGDEMRYFDAGAATVIHSFSEVPTKNIRAI